MIMGLFIDLTSAGGVQRIGRHACAALTSMSKTTGEQCKLVSFYDPKGAHHLKVGDISFTVQGFGGNRLQFAIAALRAARRTSVAYINHPNLAALGLMLRTVRPSMPYIIATYGSDAWEHLPTGRRLGLRYATKVTALTQFTAKRLSDLNGVAAHKIELHPPALEPEFVIGDGHGIRSQFPRGAKLLLTVSRLVSSERKGVDNVIQALPKLLRACPETHYLVVGDGDDSARLRGLARMNRVFDRVHFVGTKVGAELSSYYDACDVYVMPSLLEGFGVVFIEAMAFGKPVVGGKHGGTVDLIEDGRTGFLVEHGNLPKLIEVLATLLKDNQRRKRIGEAARRCVNQEYSFERFSQRLKELRFLVGGPIQEDLAH
jgi:phosphatidylinositol alpha-1,6-mannosyltransferase